METRRKNRSYHPFLIGVIVAAGIGILALVFDSLAVVPTHVGMGPFKQGLLIALAYLFLIAFDLRWNGYSRGSAIAWGLAILGGGYFVLINVFSYRYPTAKALDRIGFYSFLALMALLSGLLLRLNALSDGKFCRPIGLSERFANVLAIVFLILSLLPVVQSGFYWDDAYFSVQLPGLRLAGGSIWERTWGEIVRYVSRGRINPFATFQFFFFYLLPDARAYKVFLILMTILSVLSFWILARRIFGPRRIVTLSILLLPICFQLRLYHDPLVSYYGLMQVLMIEFCWAMTLWIDFLRSGRTGRLVGSLVLFMIGLLTYEMFYPLLLIFIMTAVFERKSVPAGLRAAWGHLLITALLFALTIALKFASPDGAAGYSGTTFSANPGKFFAAWLNQATAAFPFAYRLSAPESLVLTRLVFPREIFKTTFSTFIGGIEWCDVTALLVLFVLLSELRKAFSPAEVKPYHFAFGLALLALSSVVIALSRKYQEELVPGVGYLPVFFGYFAAAWLIFIGVARIFPWLSRRMGANTPFLIGFSVFAVLYCMNQQTNRAVIRVLNEGFLYGRETAEEALRGGILEPISDGDLLISNQPSALWETGWEGEYSSALFYSLNSGCPVNAISARAYHQAIQDEAFAAEFASNRYVIESAGNQDSGFVKFGKLIQSDPPEDGATEMAGGPVQLENPIVNSVYVFIRGFDRTADAISYVGWSGNGVTLPIRDAWLIRTTAAGRLYKVDDPKAILFDSIGLTSFR